MTQTTERCADELEARYLGEIAPRSPIVAALLALVCPGAGWAYVGRLGVGLLANLLSVALWAGFVIVWATRKFYPTLPLRAFAIGWTAIVVMAAFDAWRIARAHRDAYVLRESNHPLVYAAVALFTFVLPLVGLHHVATRNVWTVAPVDSAAMYPTLVPGDRVLVDRSGPRDPDVRTGDIVLYQLEDGVQRFGRVVGRPGDQVAVTWDLVFRNDMPAPRVPISEDDLARIRDLSGDVDQDIGHFVETLDTVAYPIVAPRNAFATQPVTWTLDDDQFVVLNDNRANTEDSRRLGVIRGDQIVGRPVFVGFSTTERIRDLPFALRVLTLSDHDPRFRTGRHGRRVQPERAVNESG